MRLSNTSGGETIRIVIVDDHDFMRRALRLLLEQEGFVISGEAHDQATAIKVTEDTEADVVVLDLILNDGESLAIIPQLKAQNPDIAIVVISGYPARAYESRAKKAGASGIYVKGLPPSELAQTIRRAVSLSHTVKKKNGQ